MIVKFERGKEFKGGKYLIKVKNKKQNNVSNGFKVNSKHINDFRKNLLKSP